LTRILILWLSFLLLSCAHGPTPAQVKEAKALYSGAKSLIEEDLYRDALQDLQKSERLNPKEPKTQYLLGVVYFSGFGRTTEAETHLRKALELETNQEVIPQILNLLGAVLIEAGRAQEALPYLERARQDILYRTPQFATQNLGLAYLRLGNFERSVEFYKSAIAQDPNLCGAYPQLADAQTRLDKLGDSIATLESFFNHCQSKLLKPFVPKALFGRSLYQLGMYHLKNGDSTSAEQVLSRCLEEYAALKVAEDCAQSLKLIQ
jgi:Tfp pilus assembly protein PilF